MLAYIIVIFVFVLAVFGTAHFVSKEIDKRRNAQDEWIKRLAETEDGRKILQEESERRERREKRIAPILLAAYFVCYAGFVALGAAGICLCI